MVHFSFQTGLPSLRGKVDLIYIDPPFDSKADYRTKLTLPGGDINQKPTTIEQFGYIPGVGDHKRQKYGARFISLIQKFV